MSPVTLIWAYPDKPDLPFSVDIHHETTQSLRFLCARRPLPCAISGSADGPNQRSLES